MANYSDFQSCDLHLLFLTFCHGFDEWR